MRAESAVFSRTRISSTRENSDSSQKEQPEAFVAELFEHIADYSWPWTWVVSDSYRQAVNAFYKTTFKTASYNQQYVQRVRQQRLPA
ncbi:hypothetical protein ACUODJ_08200, partial [Escherichia sp. HC-CC]